MQGTAPSHFRSATCTLVKKTCGVLTRPTMTKPHILRLPHLHGYLAPWVLIIISNSCSIKVAEINCVYELVLKQN